MRGRFLCHGGSGTPGELDLTLAARSGCPGSVTILLDNRLPDTNGEQVLPPLMAALP